MENACFNDTLANFMQIDEDSWLTAMVGRFNNQYDLELGDAQIRAWRDSFRWLQRELLDLTNSEPTMQILFEYRLPYESDRRPDVLLIDSKQVIILEFKQKGQFLSEDVDQASAYARDLREYHVESRDKKVTPILVLTKSQSLSTGKIKDVTTCSIDELKNAIARIYVRDAQEVDIKAWMNSKYEPLPTIVSAARRFMKHEDLPNIRRVNSTGIPEALERLTEITKDAKANNKHIMALVTGVPGAGKTFLGLKYVYDICESDKNANAIYLSGNGPLIEVLSDALGSRAFVSSVHSVVNEFLKKKLSIQFNKNIMVFDEGQRAWDQERIYSRNHQVMRQPASEPTILTSLSAFKTPWSVMLVLVGEGQEINTGEDKGIEQWNEAIDKSKHSWEVVCPPKLAHYFAGKKVIEDNHLDLNTSLRSYLASGVSRFVNHLIAGEITEARQLAPEILHSGFNMYVTRDLESAKNYCHGRYADDEAKRYGLMASSKAKNLQVYGMKAAFKPNVAKWFNASPKEYGSSCQLRTTISEFDCQGLEVDMPIVGWGDDMLWNGREWQLPTYIRTDEARNYRVNSYRVLLTRGRDGFIVFVPQEPKYDQTYQLFLNVGMEKLLR